MNKDSSMNQRPILFLWPGHRDTNTPKTVLNVQINCFQYTLRLLGMSWGVKTTCLEAPGVSLGGSGVSIGGVGSLRVRCISIIFIISWQSQWIKCILWDLQQPAPRQISWQAKGTPKNANHPLRPQRNKGFNSRPYYGKPMGYHHRVH